MYRSIAVALLTVCSLLALTTFFLLKDFSIKGCDVSRWSSYTSGNQLNTTNSRIFISWPGADVNSPALKTLVKDLEKKDIETAESEKRHRYFSSLTYFEKIRESIPEVDEVRLVDRLKGYFIGQDDKTGSIEIELSPTGTVHPREAILLISDVCSSNDLQKKIKIAGPAYLSFTTRQESKKFLFHLFPISLFLSLVVAVTVFRNAFTAFTSFTSGLFAALLAFLAVRYLNSAGDGMLFFLPLIAYFLTFCWSAHFINIYIEDWQKHYIGLQSLMNSLRDGWIVGLTAGGIVILSFALLWISGIPVAKDIAIGGSITALIVLFSVFIVTPSVLSIALPKLKPGKGLQMELIDRLTEISDFKRHGIFLLTIGLTMGALLIIASVDRKQHPRSFFTSNSKPIRHQVWHEENFSPIEVSEMTVSFPNSISLEEQFRYIDLLSRDIKKLDHQYSVFTPSIYSFGSANELDALNAAIAAGRVELSEGRTIWKINIRHPDSGAFFSKVKSLVNDPVEPTVKVSGFSSRRSSIPWNNSDFDIHLSIIFLGIVVLLFFVNLLYSQSISLTIFSLFATVLPILIGLGISGLLFREIDLPIVIATVFAFAFQACHMLFFQTWIGWGYHEKGRLEGAIRHGYRHCAGMILQTTLVIAVALLPMLWSDFRPFIRFSLSLVILLLSSAASSVLLFPALVRQFTTEDTEIEPDETVSISDSGEIILRSKPPQN